MTQSHPGVDTLNALAQQARTVHAALSTLAELYQTAQRDAPDTVPQPIVALAQHYPFGRDLADVVAQADRYADHLTSLANASGNHITSAARAIREHDQQWRTESLRKSPDADPDALYTGWQRDGLGGVCGDMGAAFNPQVQRLLADLLLAVDAADLELIRHEANLLSVAYLETRLDDWERPRSTQ